MSNFQHIIDAADRLTDSMKNMDAIFNTDDILLVQTDGKGKFVRASKGWTALLGWSEEELCSKPWIEFVHPDDIQKTEDVFSGMKDGKPVGHFVNRYITNTGEYKSILWRAPSFKEEKSVFATAVDVTDILED